MCRRIQFITLYVYILFNCIHYSMHLYYVYFSINISFSCSKLSLISHPLRRNSCDSTPACGPPPSGPCGSLDLVSHPPPLAHPALPQSSLQFLTRHRHTPTSAPSPLLCPLPGALFRDPHANTHRGSCSLPPPQRASPHSRRGLRFSL